MDKKIFRDISYGMYIVTSRIDSKFVGCIINTFCQINSLDPLISISLNKDNYTNEVIKKSKNFSVSIISNDTLKEVIGKFGYYSSRDIDKFDGIEYDLVNNLPVITENMCGYLICEVVNVIDCNTHDVMIAKVIDAKKISDNIPMTYKYYHEELKGTSPKNAPTYVEEKNNNLESVDEKLESNKYRCSLCGYIYDDAKEKVKFEDLPDTWKCPLCGATKDLFERVI